MSHATRVVWMSHGTHTNESCHTYEWVMPHLWMSHGTHTNESCHTHKWVMPHIWMSHATHMNESWHTYEWVMPHIRMSHATHMNESCHVWTSRVMRQIYWCHTASYGSMRAIQVYAELFSECVGLFSECSLFWEVKEGSFERLKSVLYWRELPIWGSCGYLGVYAGLFSECVELFSWEIKGRLVLARTASWRELRVFRGL